MHTIITAEIKTLNSIQFMNYFFSIDNAMAMMMEDTYLPAGICAGCAGDMNSFQGGGSSCKRELFYG